MLDQTPTWPDRQWRTRFSKWLGPYWSICCEADAAVLSGCWPQGRTDPWRDDPASFKGHYYKAAHDGFSWKLRAQCAEEEVEDLQRAYCETLDNGKSYSDALANTMRANFNAYDTRAAIEAMTGSRAAADAAIYMASRGWMSEDNFVPFLRTALVGRVRRLYD